MSRIDDLFSTCTTAWRLEVLDSYNIEGEQAALDAFLRNGEYVPTEDDAEWYDLIKQIRSRRGGYIGRVRLVGHPITDYTRWELAAFAGNVEAGEDIRILDRRTLDDSWNNAPDVWIFDERYAIRFRYDETGRWLGAEEIEASPFIGLRNTLNAYAVPVAQYRLTEIPSPRREPAPVTLPAAAAA